MIISQKHNLAVLLTILIAYAVLPGCDKQTDQSSTSNADKSDKVANRLLTSNADKTKKDEERLYNEKVVKFLEKEFPIGTESFDELRGVSSFIGDNSGRRFSDYKLYLESYDKLYAEVSVKENLKRMTDDVLLQKGTLLVFGKQYQKARVVFRDVIDRYENAAADLDNYIRGPRVGSGDTVRVFCLSSYYILRHPNLSADLAKFGLARCAIAEQRYDEAEPLLSPLLPNEKSRMLSEDPLARSERPLDPFDNYLRFCEDYRFRSTISHRVDKIALLWLARVKAVEGKLADSKKLYEKMITTFPTSALEAVCELKWLEAGKESQITERLNKDAVSWNVGVGFSIPKDKVLEFLTEPDLTKRIKAAKAYHEQNLVVTENRR